MLQVPLFVPPVPDIPTRPLGPLGFLHAVRTNAIRIWPQPAYEVDVLQQRFLPQRTTLLNAPEAIRRVLVDNSANYRRSRASVRILRPLVGDGLLLSEGEDWRLQRRTIAPALAPRVLPILCRHVEQCAEEMVARLAASAGPIELLTEMQAVALEIAGRSMFSLEMAQFRTRLRGELMDYAKHHSYPRLLDMVLPPHIPSPQDFGRRRFHRRWMRLVEEVMQARIAAEHAGEERDLFDLLRAARDPETGSGFSHEQLRDQIATLMIAGHETTAVTLFWALYLLAHAPAYQERIAAEAGRPLAELHVTRAVVNETLRLYPPAFTLARQALGPDQLDGLAIPAGMVLLISPWVLHRHRKLWQEPNSFDPERFMPDAPAPPRFAFLPFGAGPRICVGAQFAMAEAVIVLARLVGGFRVTLCDPAPVIPTAIITTQPNRRPLFDLAPR